MTATFFLDNDGVVERAVVSNMLPSSSRYFEGVAQTIKVLAGQDPQTAAVSAAFATTAPAVLWRTAGGFCFERTQDPGCLLYTSSAFWAGSDSNTHCLRWRHRRTRP